MPVELKEVVEFLGYKADDIKELSDLKTKFDTDFVRTTNITEDSEPVKKIVGEKLYGVERHLRQFSKDIELNLDFNSEPIKKLGLTDKFKLVISEVENKNKSVLEELKTKAGQGNDEKVKEWETKYDKLKSKFADTDSLLKKTTEDFEGFKQTSQKEVKGVKLDIHKTEIYNKAKFLPDINEYTKKGFLSDFEKKYSFDLDENEKPIIVDKKGQRIPNPKVTGTFFEPSDLLQEEIVKEKLFAINPQGGKPKPLAINIQQPASVPQRQVARRLGQ